MNEWSDMKIKLSKTILRLCFCLCIESTLTNPDPSLFDNQILASVSTFEIHALLLDPTHIDCILQAVVKAGLNQ